MTRKITKTRLKSIEARRRPPKPPRRVYWMGSDGTIMRDGVKMTRAELTATGEDYVLMGWADDLAKYPDV